MHRERTDDGRVGERLRQIRRARGLTIAQLAEATGLTKGFISQLERDLTSVSLSSLARICAALDVRFGDVLDEGATGEVVRREDLTWTPVGSHKDTLLSPRDDSRVALMESRIPPGESAGDVPYTFPAEIELVYVVEGALELRVRDHVVRLRAGETFTYSPKDPHLWRNPSRTNETVVLWFTVPNPFRGDA